MDALGAGWIVWVYESRLLDGGFGLTGMEGSDVNMAKVSCRGCGVGL